MKKKLSSRGGFTMTELLVAMAIIALLGIAVAAGISTAGRAYSDVVMSSEASVLSGTLAVELADELRFAGDISADDGVVTFTSRRFGTNASVKSDGGQITVGGVPILSKKVYTGLEAAAAVTYSGAYFTVEITIYSPGGRQLRQSSFSVAPISG